MVHILSETVVGSCSTGLSVASWMPLVRDSLAASLEIDSLGSMALFEATSETEATSEFDTGIGGVCSFIVFCTSSISEP